MVIVGFIFCSVLLLTLGVSLVLRKQTVFYVKISTLYTNKFMSCEMTLDEYTQKKKELNDGINPLLRWYMKKEGIIDV